MSNLAYGWDADEGQWPFRARGPAAAAVVVSNDEADVPSVRDAIRHGLEPMPNAALWCFLPAVWPREHRFWTPDLRARTAIVFCSDGEVTAEPTEELWSATDYAMSEEDANGILVCCGIAPRPGGRIWLLRTPDGSPVDTFLDSLLQSASQAGVAPMASPAFVEFVGNELESAGRDQS